MVGCAGRLGVSSSCACMAEPVHLQHSNYSVLKTHGLLCQALPQRRKHVQDKLPHHVRDICQTKSNVIMILYTIKTGWTVDLPYFFGDVPSFSVRLPGRPFSATCGEKNHGDFHGQFSVFRRWDDDWGSHRFNEISHEIPLNAM